MVDKSAISKTHGRGTISAATGQLEEEDFDSSDREYLYILGDAFMQCGHFQKAETIFSFIESIFSDDFHAKKCRAYSYLMQDRLEDSLALITELKQNKMDEMDYATLSLISARTYHRLGMEKEANSAMKDFIALRKVHKVDVKQEQNKE